VHEGYLHADAEQCGKELVAEFKRLRDKVYAHTDKESGRTVEMSFASGRSWPAVVSWREDWIPLDRNLLDSLIVFCQSARVMLQGYAAVARDVLDGQRPLENCDAGWVPGPDWS
jgi:hypothetical protein